MKKFISGNQMTQKNLQDYQNLSSVFEETEDQEMIRRYVSSYLDDGRVTIFSNGAQNSQTNHVVSTLEKHLIEFRVVDLTSHVDKYAISCALSIDTGYMSLPNIYFGRSHVGGFDDFISLHSCKKTFSNLLSKGMIEHNSEEMLTDDESTTNDFVTFA